MTLRSFAILALISNSANAFFSSPISTSTTKNVLMRDSLSSRLFHQANDNDMTRRELQQRLTSAVLTTATTSLIAEEALADEEEGRLIEFQVSNLEGVEGNTGSFVVRTRPSWAPKGVQRFEVNARFLCLHIYKQTTIFFISHVILLCFFSTN